MRPLTAVAPLVLASALAAAPALAVSALGGPEWPTALPGSEVSVACVEEGTTLCLLGGRFAINVAWRNQHSGTFGSGGAVPYADFSGFFWFDDPANLELMVKVVDLGGVVKVFYGQLTDLDFTLTVRDTVTGHAKEYGPGPDNCGAIDQDFNAGAVQGGVLARKRLRRGKQAKLGTCLPDDDTLCLYDARFAVEVAWRNQFSGDAGAGNGVALSNLSGLFHYGDPRNVELVVKTLDFGDRLLFLYGALSDLEYSITVTDTISGNVKTYDNPGGRYCGGIDNELAPGSGDTPEVEPNDRVAQAQVLATLPVVVAGQADVIDLGELRNTTFGDDLEDLYKVTLTQPGLTLVLSGLTADCDLYVIDSAVTRFVAQSAGPGTRDEQLLLPGLAAGTYYLAVSIFDGEPGGTSSSPYRLRVDGVSAPP